MNAKWLIAKYIPDMRRREPQNIGIILLKDEKPYLRFKGRDKADGKIDGNKTKFQKSVENYRAWVSYWEYAASKEGLDGLLRRPRPDDNFILEFGGERIIGSGSTEPEAFADELYGQLVEADTIESGLAMEARVETAIDRIFRRLDISEKVEKDLILPETADTDRLFFDFRYKNGKNTWMKRVRIEHGSEKRAMEPLYSAAWVFERARGVDTNCHLVALVDYSGESSVIRPEEYLQKHGGTVINVADESGAADGLRELLGLSGMLAIS
jgi:hypothetical protein